MDGASADRVANPSVAVYRLMAGKQMSRKVHES